MSDAGYPPLPEPREPSDRAYRETGVIIARILRIAAEREAAKAAEAL